MMEPSLIHGNEPLEKSVRMCHKKIFVHITVEQPPLQMKICVSDSGRNICRRGHVLKFDSRYVSFSYVCQLPSSLSDWYYHAVLKSSVIMEHLCHPFNIWDMSSSSFYTLGRLCECRENLSMFADEVRPRNEQEVQ